MSHNTLVQTKPGVLEFRLPDIGEGVVEGEIVKWLVKEGDEIKEDEPLVEIMTDKATMEIPAPADGKVLQLLFKEGQTCPVGGGMMLMSAEGGHAAPSHEAPATPAAAPEAPKAAAAAPATNGHVPTGERALAAPATRKLARDLGVDINQVAGSGPHGRVTKEDVHHHAEGGRPAPVASLPHAQSAPLRVEGDVERLPIRGLRKKIAEKMAHSAYTAPHVTTFDEVDMTNLVALRGRLKPKAEAQGIKLSYMPFIMKACIAALRQFPLFNASIDDANQEIVVKKFINLGFAAATDNGLMVPVVRHADQKSLFQLAREIPALAEKTREGKATLEELTGGTFTISNVGSVGGLFATPIINHPEVAILGVNKIEKRAVVRDGEIVVRDMMYLGLSFDHRLIDGADAVRFLNTVIAYMQDPDLLFAEL
ncbi:MAG TPA: dihydrolipoamide acetyltransferase family protein [Oscillatoriaceae cyanobacterium]